MFASPRCSHRLGDQRGIGKQWRFFHSDAPLKTARWSGVCVMARLTDFIVWVRVRVGVGVKVRARAMVRARIGVGVMVIHGHTCNSGRRLDRHWHRPDYPTSSQHTLFVTHDEPRWAACSCGAPALASSEYVARWRTIIYQTPYNQLYTQCRLMSELYHYSRMSH